MHQPGLFDDVRRRAIVMLDVRLRHLSPELQLIAAPMQSDRLRARKEPHSAVIVTLL
jgi:hypothetical protein